MITSVGPTVQYQRQPTAGEVKFGYGCIHYIELPIAQVLKDNGGVKAWVVIDGKRYTRV
jgi:hypothetical protein